MRASLPAAGTSPLPVHWPLLAELAAVRAVAGELIRRGIGTPLPA